MRETLHTDGAPAAVGAYNQATTTDELVCTAGQLPPTRDGDLLGGAAVGIEAVAAN